MSAFRWTQLCQFLVFLLALLRNLVPTRCGSIEQQASKTLNSKLVDDFLIHTHAVRISLGLLRESSLSALGSNQTGEGVQEASYRYALHSSLLIRSFSPADVQRYWLSFHGTIAFWTHHHHRAFVSTSREVLHEVRDRHIGFQPPIREELLDVLDVLGNNRL
ncbi:hypothetical protein BDV97DRAFT_221081 [Delphinella strobiligena]|nr:hypothetical protein BDV97DRAFT_221081 [Delphinella strobiligena]